MAPRRKEENYKIMLTTDKVHKGGHWCYQVIITVHKITEEIQIVAFYLIRKKDVVRFDVEVDDIKLVYMLQSYTEKYK